MNYKPDIKKSQYSLLETTQSGITQILVLVAVIGILAFIDLQVDLLLGTRGQQRLQIPFTPISKLTRAMHE